MFNVTLVCLPGVFVDFNLTYNLGPFLYPSVRFEANPTQCLTLLGVQGQDLLFGNT